MEATRSVLWGILAAALVASGFSEEARARSPQTVYEEASPAVVVVVGIGEGGKIHRGTGSIIDPRGLVLTNAHVVFDRETGAPHDRLFVFLRPERVTGETATDMGRRHLARVVHHDPKLDLALVQVKDAGEVPTLPFAHPDEVAIGQPALAIGHPGGGGLWTLTMGTISARRANAGGVRGKDTFQTDAGLNPGNSGGPLLDLHGRIVGVNTSIYREGPGGVTITDINFAIQSGVAVKWLREVGVSAEFTPDEAEEAEPPAVARAEKFRPDAPRRDKEAQPPAPRADKAEDAHAEKDEPRAPEPDTDRKPQTKKAGERKTPAKRPEPEEDRGASAEPQGTDTSDTKRPRWKRLTPERPMDERAYRDLIRKWAREQAKEAFDELDDATR